MKQQSNHNGKVYLIGGGPGDPELLTIKAVKVLNTCNTVIYDALINSQILQFARPEAEIVFIGKSRSAHRLSQEEVERLMIVLASQGKIVARLKGGDPFIFGRGGEEAEALSAAGIDWEVVPGISAAQAVPAYAGIPLTHRDYASNAAFITGHECANKNSRLNWHQLATAIDTLVIFMGVKNLPQIVAKLTGAGRSSSTPIAIIENGTRPDQRIRVATLATILRKIQTDPVQTPALIIIGDVVNLRKKLGLQKTNVIINQYQDKMTEVNHEVFSSIS